MNESILETFFALFGVLGIDFLLPIILAFNIYAGIHYWKGAQWFLKANLLKLFFIYFGVLVGIQFAINMFWALTGGTGSGTASAISVFLFIISIPIALFGWVAYMAVGYPVSWVWSKYYLVSKAEKLKKEVEKAERTINLK